MDDLQEIIGDIYHAASAVNGIYEIAQCAVSPDNVTSVNREISAISSIATILEHSLIEYGERLEKALEALQENKTV